MPDLEFHLIKMRDTFEYDQDGNALPMVEYVFRLGKFGPFTERVPRANFDPNAIHLIVATRRAQLAGHPV